MFWRRREKPEGDIAGAGLTDWWLATFTRGQQAYIADRYQPMGSLRTRPLVDGKPYPRDAAKLLLGMSSWFRKPQDRPLERSILEECVRQSDPASFTRHLAYGSLMENWYRDRDTDPGALDTALEYARKQVAMSQAAAASWREDGTVEFPGHAGYTQLAIVAEKQKRYADAIAVAEQAKRDGWAGDWDKRIDRCRKRAAKQAGSAKERTR